MTATSLPGRGLAECPSFPGCRFQEDLACGRPSGAATLGTADTRSKSSVGTTGDARARFVCPGRGARALPECA